MHKKHSIILILLTILVLFSACEQTTHQGEIITKPTNITQNLTPITIEKAPVEKEEPAQITDLLNYSHKRSNLTFQYPSTMDKTEYFVETATKTGGKFLEVNITDYDGEIKIDYVHYNFPVNYTNYDIFKDLSIQFEAYLDEWFPNRPNVTINKTNGIEFRAKDKAYLYYKLTNNITELIIWAHDVKDQQYNAVKDSLNVK